MTDPRYLTLADLLINYSTRVRTGDAVLIDAQEVPDEFVVALVRAVRSAGGIPVVEVRRSRISRELVRATTPAHAALMKQIELSRMKRIQVYVALRGSANSSESADVPSDRLGLYSRTLRPVLNHRVNRTRWVVLRWPNPSMAQTANMSTEAFEDFYFKVCTLDYEKMDRAMIPLERRMKRANRVRIEGPGTQLTFSVKGIGAKRCRGDRNIPDGEVFSCPVRDSVEGTIQFNAPSVYSGSRFENVRLVFRKGRIVEATSSDTKRMNDILDTDAGARYTGEFSIAFNPFILQPMGDILFDEKIAGSLHLTPGQAYEVADNGNRSAVHWDLVLIQRPEWGGGCIWFDDELIREDGRFVPKDLQALNPERLE